MADLDAVARAERLADLLSDARGTQILVELQKAAHLNRAAAAPAQTPTDPIAGRGSPGTAMAAALDPGGRGSDGMPAPDLIAGRGGPGVAVAPAPDPGGPGSDGMAAGRTVGIWRVVGTPDGPALRRLPVRPQVRQLWADVAEVPGKAGRARVAVVGESAARGYLLDPVITPTAVLQQALDRRAGAGRHQCVDLARTGAEIRQLSGVLRRLPLIDADALVLMAGNNWSLHALTVAEFDLLAAALAGGGVPGLRDAFAERVVRPRVRSLLANVQGLADRHGVRVVVVVPEFNLVEWEPGWEAAVPLLGTADLARWHRAAGRLRAAVHDGRWDGALDLAAELSTLDGGSTALPGRARGLALLARGEHAAARLALEGSRDAVTGLLAQHTPRATRQVQDELRAFARAGGHELVDLTEVFAAPGTGLPDPAYFLDYCHLSAAGMAAAMAAVADRLAGPAGRAPGQPGVVSADSAMGTAADRAIGHLLAAWHNAQVGQPESVLRRQLAAALAEDPAVRRQLAGCAQLLAETCPAWMSEAFDRLCERPHARRYLGPAAGTSLARMAGTELPAALAAALGAPAPRPAADDGPQDLLATRLDNLPDLVHGTQLGYYRATRPVLRMAIRRPARSPGLLRLVYRTPFGTGEGRITLDGAPLCALPASTGWRLLTCPLPAGAPGAGAPGAGAPGAGEPGMGGPGMGRPATGGPGASGRGAGGLGVGGPGVAAGVLVGGTAAELAIHWPDCAVDEAEQQRAAARQLARAVRPSLFARFGEMSEAEVLPQV